MVEPTVMVAALVPFWGLPLGVFRDIFCELSVEWPDDDDNKDRLTSVNQET